MRKVYGVKLLSFGSRERGLWFDSDERGYQPKKWGFFLNIVLGKMIRPVPKFWIKDNNPWKGDEPWFILRFPWMVAPFLSVAIGRFGFYIGCKTFLVKNKHLGMDRYGRWLRFDELGDDDDPSEFLQLSATFRRTRWK